MHMQRTTVSQYIWANGSVGKKKRGDTTTTTGIEYISLQCPALLLLSVSSKVTTFRRLLKVRRQAFRFDGLPLHASLSVLPEHVHEQHPRGPYADVERRRRGGRRARRGVR